MISVRSVQEIDHLIEGLQGLREKLNNDGDRLNRQIVQYGAFSQSIPDEDRLGRDGVSEQIKLRLKTFQFAQEKSADEVKDSEPQLHGGVFGYRSEDCVALLHNGHTGPPG